MGRKIPTCFYWSYLEANIISPLINWLDPDGKYIMVAPDWSLPLLNCHVSSRRFYVVKEQQQKKKKSISSTDAERESKFVCLVRKANITVFLLQSASAKR